MYIEPGEYRAVTFGAEMIKRLTVALLITLRVTSPDETMAS